MSEVQNIIVIIVFLIIGNSIRKRLGWRFFASREQIESNQQNTPLTPVGCFGCGGILVFLIAAAGWFVVHLITH